MDAVNETGEWKGVPFTLIRKHVRSVRIRVLTDGSLMITAPPGFDVAPLLATRAGWIARKRAGLEMLAVDFAGTGDLLLFDGGFYHLVHGEFCGSESDSFFYTTPDALRKMIISRLRRDLEERLSRNSEIIGVSYGRFAIKKQKTRWGSCSGLGNLNFNLRLAALPEDLREYVVIHELAHLRVPDHSSAFWSLVEEFYPAHRDAKAGLRKYWVAIGRNMVWKELLA